MYKSSIFKSLALVFGVFLTAGCDKEFHSVGIDLLENSIFEMESETYPLYLFQNQLERVQTNGMPLAMLGNYSHPVFGKTEATITSQLQINPAYVFGNYSQVLEEAGDPDDVKVIDENESVTEVFLEIPFFNNQMIPTLMGLSTYGTRIPTILQVIVMETELLTYWSLRQEQIRCQLTVIMTESMMRRTQTIAVTIEKLMCMKLIPYMEITKNHLLLKSNN